MKFKQFLFFLIAILIVSCKIDVGNTIKGNWFFFEIREDKKHYYNEVFFDEDTLFFYLDWIGDLEYRKYIIRNDSLIQINRILKDEIRPSKIKIINKNRFKTYNEFGGITVYHRIVGNHFTIDSIKNEGDLYKYEDAFIERKKIQFYKANISFDDELLVEEEWIGGDLRDSTINKEIYIIE